MEIPSSWATQRRTHTHVYLYWSYLLQCCLDARHRPTDHLTVQYPQPGPSSHQSSVSVRDESRAQRERLQAPYLGWKYPDQAGVKLVRRSWVKISLEIGMRSLLLRGETNVINECEDNLYRKLKREEFFFLTLLCKKRINNSISSEFHEQNQMMLGRYGVTCVKQLGKLIISELLCLTCA